MFRFQVTTYPKEFRTGDDAVPKQALEYKAENPHVQDAVKMTIQDWNVVNRRYSICVQIVLRGCTLYSAQCTL